MVGLRQEEWESIKLQITSTLNPAALLPNEASQTPGLVIELGKSSRWDLTDQSQLKRSWNFTDEHSFMDQGKLCAGYAVVTLQRTLEAKTVPPGSSTKKGGDHCFPRALLLAEGKQVHTQVGKSRCTVVWKKACRS